MDSPTHAERLNVEKGAVATYLMAWLIIFCAVPFFVWSDVLFGVLTQSENKGPLMRLMIYVMCSGGLGAIILCIRGLCKHSSDGTYNAGWAWWYVFMPILGPIFGLMSFVFIKGGLVVFGSGPESMSFAEPFRIKAAYLCAGFLAGFCQKDFLSRLRSLARTIFATEGENRQMTNDATRMTNQ